MSTYSSPERPVSEIISVLASMGIAELKPEDISNPTTDVICSVYQNFLDLLNAKNDGQISFTVLEILENPELYVNSIKIFDLYCRIKDLLSSIHISSFTVRDLVAPVPRRTHHILSNVVDFILYRNDKMKLLQPIVDQFTDYEQSKMEFESRIAELNKEIMNHEVASQMEEPVVQELDAEVKELRQKIQNYNKHQASLKTVATGLKKKIDTTDDSISKVDFEGFQRGQENVDLLSNIVQSPEKLQKALEIKKLNRAEVKQSERSVEQRVQEQAATLEVYSKAFEKLSKLLSPKMQNIHENINSVKAVGKDTKSLKAMLRDQDASYMKFDTKIVESQGKAKQCEELVKAAEREENLRHAEDNQRLVAVKAEMELKLSSLVPRERNIEATIGKVRSLFSETESVREAENVTIEKIMAEFEEIVGAFHSYSNTINPHLQFEEVGESASEEQVAQMITHPTM